MLFCEKCGAPLENDAMFCAGCGAKAGTEVSQQAPPPVYAPASQPPGYPQAPTQPQQPGYPQARPMPSGPAHPGAAYAAPAPQNAEAMSMGDYIKMFVISAIPIVGFILLLMWAFGATSGPNKRNFAKAYLVVMVVGVILMGSLSMCTAFGLSSLF